MNKSERPREFSIANRLIRESRYPEAVEVLSVLIARSADFGAYRFNLQYSLSKWLQEAEIWSESDLALLGGLVEKDQIVGDPTLHAACMTLMSHEAISKKALKKFAAFARRTGEHVLASDLFFRLAKLEARTSDKANAIYESGRARLHARMYAKSIERFEEALAMDPTAKAHHAMGVGQSATGRSAKCRNLLQGRTHTQPQSGRLLCRTD